MRILLSAYSCEPHRGSEPGMGWYWASILAKQGHSVWVLTTSQGKSAIEREMSTHRYGDLHFIYVDLPKWCLRIFSGHFGAYFKYLLWQKNAYKKVAGFRDEIDLIHHVSWASLTGGSYLWMLGKPFYFGPAGGGQTAPSMFLRYFGRMWPSEWLRSFITNHIVPRSRRSRAMLQKAVRFYAANSDTAILAKRLGASNVELLLDVALPEEFLPSSIPERMDREELHVLWVGRLLHRKGLSLALEAIYRTNVPAKLTVLGDGPQRDFLKKWIKNNDMERRVECRGSVPWDEVKSFYQSSDVFLFTSLRDTSGMQLLEAMAFGLPVICLDHHGAHDWMPESAGIKVPVTSPETTIEALVHAIDRLHDSKDLRLQMGEAGHDCALMHTWNRKVRYVASTYEK